MDKSFINAYLKRAQEIIGDRSPGEIDYDDAVVTHLKGGKNIKEAIEVANRQFPEEALEPAAYGWEDLESRYQYLKDHKAILAKLNRKR